MNSSDELEMVEVEVVVDASRGGGLEAVIASITKMGLVVQQVDRVNGMICGELASDRLSALKKYPAVTYVRVIFAWIAESHPAA